MKPVFQDTILYKTDSSLTFPHCTVKNGLPGLHIINIFVAVNHKQGKPCFLFILTLSSFGL